MIIARNRLVLVFTVSMFVLASGLPVFASVSLIQNLGATWVDSPTIMTASTPLTSKEGNWGSSAPYSLGQSFTAPVCGVLTNIQLYGSGNATANILLYLYDMGPAIQYASQPSPVVSGSNSVTTVVSGNLFSTNLAITMSAAGNDSVMQLTFSEADAVQLIGGHEYMFTMISTNSSPMYWDDGGGDLYMGGAAYRQNSFINDSSATDFSLAVKLLNTNAGPTIYDCVVDWNNVHQRIDGFGASSAWRSVWTTNEANMFFGTNSGTGTSIDGTTNFPFNGIGLSLLRSRVNTNGTGTYESSIMQMAQARGARVWSTPWSPPPQFKSNNNVNGGNYLGSGANATNLAYASLLAQYVVNMKNQYGVNIYALSVQNEPDVSAGYESCLWTTNQFHDFVTNLSSALAAHNVASTKIIIPEDEKWEPNYYTTAMMDPAVATNVSIVACHDYSGSPPNDIPTTLPLYANTNAATWETETAELSGVGAFNPSMTDAIYWAGRIHLFMTGANVNAWHYWWLISDNPDNEGLTDTNGIPAQRMYVLGQYSRFIHPNNYRIDLANYNPYAILGSAYKDPVSGNFAIVISNTNSTTTTQSFSFTNFTALTVTPWITSANLSLAAQSAVNVTNSTFSYSIPGMSVVTFVGTAQPGISQGSQQTPLIAIAPTASAITYGQTLASSTLSGGAATNQAGAVVSGTFAFTIPSTTPVAGTSDVPVTFTPSDDVNYIALTTSVQAVVAPATITVTAGNQTKTAGLPNPALTAAYSGFVNGDGTNALTTLASLSTPANASSPAGSYAITPANATAANYIFTYVPGTLTVVAPPQMTGVNVNTTGLGISFPTLPGQIYQLVVKSNLTDTVWTSVGSPISGTGGSISITNNFGAVQDFYMLQILQP